MSDDHISKGMVTLEVTSAELSSGFGWMTGRHKDGQWLIGHKVKLPWRDTFELETGEGKGDIELSVTVSERTQGHVDWAAERAAPFMKPDDHLHGLVYYFAGHTSSYGDGSGPSLMFEVFAPAEVMESLVRLAEQGRHVRQFTFEVPGVSYGPFPDGSQKKWEGNRETKWLPITNVDYRMSVVDAADEGAEETGLNSKPQTPVGADLAPLLRELLKFQKWALWALAAIAVVSLFRG